MLLPPVRALESPERLQISSTPRLIAIACARPLAPSLFTMFLTWKLTVAYPNLLPSSDAERGAELRAQPRAIDQRQASLRSRQYPPPYGCTRRRTIGQHRSVHDTPDGPSRRINAF